MVQNCLSTFELNKDFFKSIFQESVRGSKVMKRQVIMAAPPVAIPAGKTCVLLS